MTNIILFGPPGSGKGTQAEKLKDEFNLLHLSTGDLLRKEKESRTPLGIEAQKYADQGILVPDSIVIEMIANIFETVATLGKEGVIFDGFPRTVAQAMSLDNLLKERSIHLVGLISLKVNENETIARIIERGKSSGRADDTNLETIKRRFLEYKEKTELVAKYYSEQHKYFEVSGIGSIDAIFSSIKTLIVKLS